MTPTYEQKLAMLAENKDFAIFNELSSLNENVLANTEAIKAIPETIIPEAPEQLEEVSVKNFPDVQKVEVTNFPIMPEHKAPVVNVAAPIVKVDAPIVKIDNQGVADEIKKITDLLSKEENKAEIEKVKVLDSEGKVVDFKALFNHLSTNIGNIKVSGGGLTGEVFIKGNSQNRINPATSEKQGQYYDSETGLWTNIGGMDGVPATITYEVMIARHLIPGHSAFRGFGERVGITAITAGNDICQITATSIPLPTQPTGDLMTVVSTSASDGVAGTGVQSLDVHYLDASGNAQSLIVTMNGTTPVDIPAIYMRFVQSIHTETVGTNGTTVGTITIYKTGFPATVYNQLVPGGNVSLNSARMIPAGKSFYMRNLSVMAANKTAVSVRLRATSDFEDVLTTGYFFLFKDVSILENSSREKTFVIPLHFPALSVLKFTAYTSTAGAEVSINYDGWIE